MRKIKLFIVSIMFIKTSFAFAGTATFDHSDYTGSKVLGVTVVRSEKIFRVDVSIASEGSSTYVEVPDYLTASRIAADLMKDNSHSVLHILKTDSLNNKYAEISKITFSN